MEDLRKGQNWQVSEVELVYKSRIKQNDRPKVNSSKDAYQTLLQSWDERKIEFIEQFKVLMLNQQNRILGMYEVSSGGLTGTQVDKRQVFCAALLMKATGIVLAHNHPSGALRPSETDRVLTRELVSAGKILSIPVIDHLIVTTEGYFSFADEGLI